MVSFMGTWRAQVRAQPTSPGCETPCIASRSHATGAVYLTYLGREEQEAERLVRCPVRTMPGWLP